MHNEYKQLSNASVCHGDYRLDNFILDDEFNIKAIVDYELTTLGYGIFDLANYCQYW